MTRFLTKLEGCPSNVTELRFSRLEDAKDFVEKQPRDGGRVSGVGYGGNTSGWRIIVGEVDL